MIKLEHTSKSGRTTRATIEEPGRSREELLKAFESFLDAANIGQRKNQTTTRKSTKKRSEKNYERGNKPEKNSEDTEQTEQDSVQTPEEGKSS